MTDDVDADQLVERTDTGVSITSKLTRGTGTRDQDVHTIKAKGHTLVDAVSKHKRAMKYLEAEVVDRARELQPGEADGDESEEGGDQ
ncbi:DUF7389 domain-containing protein [Natrinema halophilum]|uniref:DUF7389 domain-containing protein n=1 Tax=Natrinema halophilum TaxID=1699371 RepID=A0A7D5L3D3_9EURY|nr:hypothetical protein [Natrinema halophilum]QLG49105.1 hypothetical protein HYG82_09700 [Natrinema halophilum]